MGVFEGIVGDVSGIERERERSKGRMLLDPRGQWVVRGYIWRMEIAQMMSKNRREEKGTGLI